MEDGVDAAAASAAGSASDPRAARCRRRRRSARPTARPAPTCRRPASTSRTPSRPTAARCSGSRAATWSPTTSPATRCAGSARPTCPGPRAGQHRDPALGRHRGRDRPSGAADGDARPRPAVTELVTLDVSDPAAPDGRPTPSSTTPRWSPRGCTTAWCAWCSRPGCPTSTSPSPTSTPPSGRPPGPTEDLVRESTIEDWLPERLARRRPERAAARLRPGRDPRRRHDARHHRGGRLRRARARSAPSVSGLAVDTDLAYASADQLYLATSADVRRSWSAASTACEPMPMPDSRRPAAGLAPRGGADGCATAPAGGDADDGTSHLYAFDLDGIDTTFAASGEVDGVIRDRWSMDAVRRRAPRRGRPDRAAPATSTRSSPSARRATTSSRPAGSTSSASARRSSRSAGSTPSRSSSPSARSTRSTPSTSPTPTPRG